ncbi:MAG: hypothetical protein WC438_06275 [Candidatus Pacearchaeota archaeon]
MSAYTTKTITRKEAEELLKQIYSKSFSFANDSDKELEEELDRLSYSDKHTDILGVLYNFRIKQDEK